jgi:LysM repeat protein
MSACVVLAWCILPIAAVVGSRETGHPAAQANISIASSTQVVLTSESGSVNTAKVTIPAPAGRVVRWTVRPGDTLSAIAAALRVPGGWQALYTANRSAIGPDPDLIRPGAVLTLPGTGSSARYTVAPGDTLSAIAAALGLPGGWQALYAANRSAIGPDPGVISPGTVLITPRPVNSRQASAQPPARRKNPAAPPRTAPAPAGRQPAPPANPAPNTGSPPSAGRQPNGELAAPGHRAAPGHFTIRTGGMPRWLEDVLLAAGVLAATAFAAEPAAALTRRRKANRPARPRAPGAGPRLARQAAKKARIILANYERLIVTYSTSDHTVYVLTPPGEDPSAVLRAARLILPENTYEDLAAYLGLPPCWPLE